MGYSIKLAAEVRRYLARIPALKIEEKKMFRGLIFMVNGKMCLCVSDDNLMCRFDPIFEEVTAEKKGFMPMIMKGRKYKGFCYVRPDGYKEKKDFQFWVKLCLDYNKKAKSSKNI
ncbi:MAG: TfoX/Sxy family protein [Ferruginibacter sp.]